MAKKKYPYIDDEGNIYHNKNIDTLIYKYLKKHFKTLDVRPSIYTKRITLQIAEGIVNENRKEFKYEIQEMGLVNTFVMVEKIVGERLFQNKKIKKLYYDILLYNNIEPSLIYG